ncbi:MAG: hypothetical protein HY711_05525 [Candidatus Melainabacteria bacterium]|nr:hypothetical protein [Candidatus Melainabacteria bacterium]
MVERLSSANDNAIRRAPDTLALELLQQEIDAHRKQQVNRSYLCRAVDSVGSFFTQDNISLAGLEDLYQKQTTRLRTGQTVDVGAVNAAIKSDRERLGLRQEIDHYAGGFLKTTALFMRGKLGLAGTVAIYALDQMNPEDNVKNQLADLMLGGAKGGLMKGMFHLLGNKPVNIATKGVGLGISLRVLESALTRSTYTDVNTGQTNLQQGLKNTVRESLAREALAADVIIFGAAHGLLGKANVLSGRAIEHSPLLSTMLTGTTFGMSTGAWGEIQRELATGQKLDLSKIIKSSLIQGAIDTFAAGPGGLQARAAAYRLPAEHMVPAKEPLVRNFVVTEGQEVLARFEGIEKQRSGLLRVQEILEHGGRLVRQLGPEKSLFLQHLGDGERFNPQAAPGVDLLAFCNPELARGPARQRHLFSNGSGLVWFSYEPGTRVISFNLGEQPYRPVTARSFVLGTSRTITAVDVLEEHGHLDYADIVRGIPELRSLKAVGYVGEGNESFAIQLAPSRSLPNGGVLKATLPESGWQHWWGDRKFDAKIIGEVHEADLPGGGTAYVYIQELVEVRSRYEQEKLDAFFRKVERSGLEFADPGSDPTKQIGERLTTGELVLIDYSAIDKPGANETHKQIIGGQQYVKEQYEADDAKDYKGRRSTSQPENYESVVDLSLEQRRIQALEDNGRAPHETSILKQLFQGDSLQDVIIMRACELPRKPDGQLDMDTAQAQVQAVYTWAKKQRLLRK